MKKTILYTRLSSCTATLLLRYPTGLRVLVLVFFMFQVSEIFKRLKQVNLDPLTVSYAKYSRDLLIQRKHPEQSTVPFVSHLQNLIRGKLVFTEPYIYPLILKYASINQLEVLDLKNPPEFMIIPHDSPSFPGFLEVKENAEFICRFLFDGRYLSIYYVISTEHPSIPPDVEKLPGLSNGYCTERS